MRSKYLHKAHTLEALRSEVCGSQELAEAIKEKNFE